MGDSESTVAQGIAPFLGRFFLGILTCALVGLALAFAFTLVWDPDCERDCDVLSVLCVAGGLLLGVFVGLFVALSDRGRHSRGALNVLMWRARLRPSRSSSPCCSAWRTTPRPSRDPRASISPRVAGGRSGSPLPGLALQGSQR